jgi:hypothetical protein
MGGEWSVLRSRFIPRERAPGTQEIGVERDPSQVWTQGLEEKSFSPTGDRTPVVKSVARPYTELRQQCKAYNIYRHVRENVVSVYVRKNASVKWYFLQHTKIPEILYEPHHKVVLMASEL